MIRTDYTAVSLCPPLYISAYRVNTYIEGTKSLADILNNCHVDINQTSPIQITCSRHFYDKQRARDWTNGNRGCSCWGVSCLGGLNIALTLKFVASDGVGVQVFMWKVSSTSFKKSICYKVYLLGFICYIVVLSIDGQLVLRISL